MKIISFPIVCFIFLGWSHGIGAVLPSGVFTSTLTYRGTYNNNLLNYSPRDRGLFFDRAELHPSPIRSLDDWRTDLKLGASYQTRFYRNLDTELQTTLDFAHHLMDPIKNFGWLSLSLRQELGRGWDGSLAYFYEPEYYIRDYRDLHSREYHPCDFTLAHWTVRAGYRPNKNIQLFGQGRIKEYYYNGYFTEYDGNTTELNFGAALRMDPWRMSLSWGYSEFKNTGFNSLDRLPAGLILADNEVGQADYAENEYSASVSYNYFFFGRRARAAGDLSITNRYYATGRPPELDPVHAGRKDMVTATALSAKQYWTKRLAFELGWEYAVRDSKADLPLASLLKDYYRWSCWLEMSYQLW